MAKARKTSKAVVKKVKIQVGKKSKKQQDVTLRLDVGKKRTLLAMVTFGHT